MGKLGTVIDRGLPTIENDPDLRASMQRNPLEDAERARRQAEQLRETLHHAKDQIGTLREEVDKLAAPPASFGTFQVLNPDRTATIHAGGRKLKVNVHPAVDGKGLRPGQELLLNDALNIIEAAGFETQGEVVRLKDRLAPNRVLITCRADEDRVAELAAPLHTLPLQVGDPLLYDPRAGYVLERLPRAEVEDLLLEEVPHITYQDIGGLARQIELIQDALELPDQDSDGLEPSWRDVT